MRALVCYLGLTLCLAFPLTVHPASRVLQASPDAKLFMWMLAWDTHAFTHQPLAIFDANIYYPERHTLAYSENLIGSAVVAAPVLWLTGNPVLAMNLVALLSCVLCGFGAYRLARQAGIGEAGALLTGVVFAFAPPRFFRLSQLHLTTVQWVPFGLASLHAYLDSGRRRDLRLTIGWFTVQALTSGHGAVFFIVCTAALAAYRAATGDKIAPLRRMRDAGWPGLALLAPVLLIGAPYLTVQREMGLRRTLDNWSVSWTSFAASPTHIHAWLLSLIPAARINERADAFLFPGFFPILLALAGIWTLTRDRTAAPDAPPNRPSIRRTTVFYTLLTLVGLWLSVGRPIGLWPLVYWLPGMNFIRVPSRFMVVTVLGVAMLGGVGFEWLAAPFDARRRRVLALVIGAALVGEFAAAPLDTEAFAVDPPPIDRWLDGQPKPFAIAEVPLGNPRQLGPWERRHTEFMLHATAHWQKTVEGYSGIRPPLLATLYEQLTTFPDEHSIGALDNLGVTYIVVHTDMYPPGEWENVERRLTAFTDRLALQHVEGDGRVYAMTRDK
jgi:hypothetical protein